MADFAVWATACETAFWPAGTFMAAYNDNLQEVVDTVIDADAVGSAVRQMATKQSSVDRDRIGVCCACSAPSSRKAQPGRRTGLAARTRCPTGCAAP